MMPPRSIRDDPAGSLTGSEGEGTSMKRLLCGIALAAIFAAALPVTGLAGEPANPLFGTWLLNRAKSTFIPAPGPKRPDAHVRTGG